MRVIIVEDQLNWQEQLEEVFEEAGHQVLHIFDDAEGVFEMAKRLIPDLIVIDIHLGLDHDGKSGILLANQLEPLNIPFVYLTGKEQADFHEKAYKVGNAEPFRYLYKTDFFRRPELVISNLDRELKFHDPSFVVEEETVIRFSNVLWIHGEGRSGTIYCKDGQTYSYRGQLNKFIDDYQQSLKAPILYYANRNEIVNIFNVKSWQKEGRQYHLFFDQDKTLPENGILVSHRKSQQLIQILHQLNGSK